MQSQFLVKLLEKQRKQAFTLVETVLSIAIIASLAVPAFALMALGSTMNQESRDLSVTASILDQVAREYEQTDFSDLSSPSSALAFNSEGVRLRSTAAPDRFYKVKVTVDKSGLLPGSSTPSGNLAVLLLDIAADPASSMTTTSGTSESTLFATDSNGEFLSPNVRRHTLLVSRND